MISGLLNKIFDYLIKEKKAAVIQKAAKALFRSVLEWLCDQHDEYIWKGHNILQLLSNMTPHEPLLMHQWNDQLKYWADKFFDLDHYRISLSLEDIGRFKGFILLFLHDLKDRSESLERLMNEEYPILGLQKRLDEFEQVEEAKELKQIEIFEKVKREEAGLKKKSQSFRINQNDSSACPFCETLLQPLKGIPVKCPTCSLYLEYIEVGVVLDSIRHEPVLIKIPDLTLGSVIVGIPKTGKSFTALWIVYQVLEHNIPCWTFEYEKTMWRHLINLEYRNPKTSIETWHFTLANENVNPFRWNPLGVERGVTESEHREKFRANFTFSYNMEEWADDYIRLILAKIYKNRKNEGRIPLPIDLLEPIKSITKQYSQRLGKDLEGYLKMRVRDFNLEEQGYMFNCNNGLNISELVTKNVIFEMRNMDKDTKRFFTTMLLTSLFEYVSRLGGTKNLRLLIILEEAHELISKNPTGKEGVSYQANDIVEKFFRQSREYGVGLMVIDHIPKDMPEMTLSLSRTGIIHRLKNEKDLQKLAENFRISQYIRHIVGLKLGQAIVETEASRGAQKVKIHEFPKIPGDISDEQIKQFMVPFYAARPWLRNPDPDIKKRVDALLDEEQAIVPYKKSPLLPQETGEEMITPQDLLMGITPPEIDLTCAELEMEHLISNDNENNPLILQGSYPLNKCYKKNAIKKFNDPRVRLKLKEIYEIIKEIEIGSPNSREIFVNIFQDLMRLAIRGIPDPIIPLPSVVFFLKYLIFRVFKLTFERQIALYCQLLELLATSGENWLIQPEMGVKGGV